MKPDWNRIASVAEQMGATFDSVWKCGCLLPRRPSPPAVQSECDGWCRRLLDPNQARQALFEWPPPLRQLILGRFAMAAYAAAQLSTQHRIPEGVAESAALGYLLTEHWHRHVLPNWHCLGEDFFAE
jgi:hypothetical protein